MTWQPITYNPLDFCALSESIARKLVESPTISLDDVREFEGPGVYALYYRGPFPAYAPLSMTNKSSRATWPIYVGRAGASTRKGEVITPDDLSGDALYKRLMKHRQSIEAAENLETSDFDIRVLIVPYLFVPLAEASAISMYTPIWNTCIDGFGNHDPGNGRYKGMKPRWDTVHPGRAWATKMENPNVLTAQEIEREALTILTAQERARTGM